MRLDKWVPKVVNSVCHNGATKHIQCLLGQNTEAHWGEKESDSIDQLWEIQWGQHDWIHPTQTWASIETNVLAHTYTKPILYHWPYKITGSEQWLMTGQMSRNPNYVLHLSVRMHVRDEQTDRAGLRPSGFVFMHNLTFIITFGVFDGCIAFECICKLCVRCCGFVFHV